MSQGKVTNLVFTKVEDQLVINSLDSLPIEHTCNRLKIVEVQ